jgi:hypothetical protein
VLAWPLSVYIPQDLSYLEGGRYRPLMRQWIQAAVPVPASTSHALAADCDPGLPDDPDPRDMRVRYTGNLNYTAIAKLLKPMLPDIRVSWGWFMGVGRYGCVLVRPM